MKAYKIFLLLALIIGCWQSAYSQESDMMLPVRIGMKWGYVNTDGEVVIQPQFDYAGDFGGFGAQVKVKDQYGVIDRAGNVIIPFQYYKINVLSNDVASVTDGKSWGLINRTGELIIPVEFISVAVPDSNFIILLNPSGFAVASSAGNVISKDLIDEYQIINKDFIQVKKNEKYGLYNKEGREIIAINVDKIVYPDRENSLYFSFIKNGLRGLVNSRGQSLLRAEWYDVVFFDNQRLKVLGPKGWGLFDLIENRFTLQPEYSQLSSFTDNTLIIYNEGLRGLATASGRILISPRFDEIKLSGHPVLLQVRTGRRWGLANQRGEMVMPMDFDKIIVEGNIVKAFKRGGIHIFNLDDNGDITDEAQYANVRTIKVIKTYRPPDNRIFFTSIANNAESRGWYYDQQRNLWGLKDSLDTIKIKPVFKHIMLYADLDLAEVSVEDRSGLLYGLYDHATDRFLIPPLYSDIKTEDFRKGAFARAIAKSGYHSIIYRNGKTLSGFAFTGLYNNGKMRLNLGGRLRFQEEKGKGFVISVKDLCEINQRLCFRYIARNYKPNLHIDGGYWGFIDSLGNIDWIKGVDFVEDIVNGTVVFAIDDKWGVMNEDFNVIIPPEYDGIDYFTKSPQVLFKLKINKRKMAYTDNFGRLVTAFEYDEGLAFNEGITAVKKNNIWQVINHKGETVEQTSATKMGIMENGFIPFRNKRLWGFLDESGQEIISADFRNTGSFSEGLCAVEFKRKVGYIRENGEWAIQPRFSFAGPFTNGVAVVKSGYQYGLINKEGRFLLKPRYQKIELYPEEQLIFARKKKGYQIFDWNAQRKNRKSYPFLRPPSDGLIPFTRKGSGYLDFEGNEVIKNDFKWTESFQDGLARASLGSKWGYIDHNGNWIIPPVLSRCSDFHQGRAAFRNSNGFWGLIDKNGDTIINNIYRAIQNFSDGFAVALNAYGRYEFIDINGKKAFDKTFDVAYPFENGLAIVKNRNWGVIDIAGNYILDPNYSEILPFSEGLAPVYTEALAGIADSKGNILLDIKYENVTYVGNDIFKLWSGNKVLYINSSGNWIWRD